MKLQIVFGYLAMIFLAHVLSTTALRSRRRQIRSPDFDETTSMTQAIATTSSNSSTQANIVLTTTSVAQVISQNSSDNSTAATTPITTSTIAVINSTVNSSLSTTNPSDTTTNTTVTSTVSTVTTSTSTQAPTTASTTAVTAPPTTKEPGRKFDGLSFIGGMILATGLGALIFLVLRYLRRGSATPYSNLR